VLCGFGIEGYALAITGLAAMTGARPDAAKVR
jgi:3-dehydroquinate dehydratase